MTFQEILKELPKLTSEEREEILEKIIELDRKEDADGDL
jgi:hypothetical protein